MNKTEINTAEVTARFWQVATSVSASFPLEATLIALRQLDSSGDLNEQTLRHRANALCFEMVCEKLEIRGFELTACRKKVRELEQSLASNCFTGDAQGISASLDAAKREMEEKRMFFMMMGKWQLSVARYVRNTG
jgi:hypothetical protein